MLRLAHSAALPFPLVATRVRKLVERKYPQKLVHPRIRRRGKERKSLKPNWTGKKLYAINATSIYLQRQTKAKNRGPARRASTKMSGKVVNLKTPGPKPKSATPPKSQLRNSAAFSNSKPRFMPSNPGRLRGSRQRRAAIRNLFSCWRHFTNDG